MRILASNQICYTIGMQREDYLKDYYESLEEAPIDVLEEYKGNVIAALEDYNAASDKKAVRELENDLDKVRQLMEKRRES
jgi:hypothetical protein